VLHTHIQLHVAFIRRNNLVAFQEGMLFQKSGSTGEKNTFALFFCLHQVKVIMKRTVEERVILLPAHKYNTGKFFR
jgi:recombinational DNA repair ATPase RecF